MRDAPAPQPCLPNVSLKIMETFKVRTVYTRTLVQKMNIIATKQLCVSVSDKHLVS